MRVVSVVVHMKLSGADVAVVAVSVVSVVSFGIYTSLTKSSKNAAVSDEYFLARRSMPWFIVAASLFAANVGTFTSAPTSPDQTPKAASSSLEWRGRQPSQASQSASMNSLRRIS